MRILPVIDIRRGIAVHGRGGSREAYPPLVTPLSPDSDPINIARGFRALAPFSALYVADLDAIEGRGANQDLLARLTHELPDLTIWLDAGFARWEEAAQAFANPRVTVVIGSESQTGLALLAKCRAAYPDRVVLSLDFRGETFEGPPELRRPEVWPSRVIAMTLGKVGSGAGPDIERIAALKRASPDSSIFAAGGIRNAGDLDGARQAGAAGALIATALHQGAISAEELAAYRA